MTNPVAGRWLLAERIGRGGTGHVWRARDLRTGHDVALKQLAHVDGEALLRFVREQGVRIAHPHVVSPTSWAAVDDEVWLAMDLVRGGSVRVLLDDHGPLPEDFVRVLLDQAAAALVAVHAAGVVHRDVTPANLLLEPTGTGMPHVRLADFGVAVSPGEARLTLGPHVVGTPGYLAPELRTGAVPDPAQDVYALGVVARELLDAEPPDGGGRDPWPTGLGALLAEMTDPERIRRPDALGVRERLAALGVPTSPTWRDRPDPPEVFDHVAPGRP